MRYKDIVVQNITKFNIDVCDFGLTVYFRVFFNFFLTCELNFRKNSTSIVHNCKYFCARYHHVFNRPVNLKYLPLANNKFLV